MALTVLISACLTDCGPGSGAAPATISSTTTALSAARRPQPVAAAPALSSDNAGAANWIVTSSVLPGGAIAYTSQAVSPYYANIAALALARQRVHLDVVGAWMQWYVAHLNMPDKWGLSGSIYDYAVGSDGSLTSTLDADSTDSYAATFLSLARAYYESGDAAAQLYVRSIRSSLSQVASVILATQQSDGLTIAKPDYPVRYVMDNAEVYHGALDYATLAGEAFGDAATAQAWNANAARIAAAINSELWNAATNTYYVEMDANGGKQAASWTTWYPDATAQLFPIVHGVLAPGASRATSLYAAFNKHYPAWDQLQIPDAFPWAMVADAAVVMGDTGRALLYVQAVESKYAASGFPWPWYCAEAGWFVDTTALLAAT